MVTRLKRCRYRSSRPVPAAKAPWIVLASILLLSGCAPRRDSPPAAERRASGRPNVSVRRISGYVPLLELAPQMGGQPLLDELATLYTWTDGVRRVVAAPGLHALKVDGATVSTGAEVLVHEGQLYVASAASTAVQRRLFGPSLPVAPVIPGQAVPFHVVLDAGHGGPDPGAIGRSGLREKDVNLDVALQLERFLRARGVQVTLTRRSDLSVSLEERVEIANRAAPDLFLAIHANWSSDPLIAGFELFDRDSRVDAAERARESAAVGPHPSEYKGRPFPTDPELRRQLYEELFAQYRRDSAEAARCIRDAYVASLKLTDRGIKPHRLHVLRWTRCPAVLMETGFLSNSGEEEMLSNGEQRRRIAEAIGLGLLKFRETVLAPRRR